jgi:hypothetical protein
MLFYENRAANHGRIHSIHPPSEKTGMIRDIKGHFRKYRGTREWKSPSWYWTGFLSRRKFHDATGIVGTAG